MLRGHLTILYNDGIRCSLCGVEVLCSKTAVNFYWVAIARKAPAKCFTVSHILTGIVHLFVLSTAHTQSEIIASETETQADTNEENECTFHKLSHSTPVS